MRMPAYTVIFILSGEKKNIGTFAIEISNFTLDWMLDDNGLDDDAELHHQCLIRLIFGRLVKNVFLLLAFTNQLTS